MKTYKKIIKKNRLEIYYDNCVTSPRNWSNLGYFITCENNRSSPDNNKLFINIIKDTSIIACNSDNHITLIKQAIELQTNEKVLKIYPIFRYRHSDIHYGIGIESGFDYSNCGFYIITNKTQNRTGTTKENFDECVNDELNIYNKYINGNIYKFELYDKNEELEDSCNGFYDIEDMKLYLSEEWENEDLTNYLINN